MGGMRDVDMTKMKTIMTINEIKSNLCYWDSRNPDGVGVDDQDLTNVIECHCDNCLYGRTQLAEELIKLINIYQIPQKNG